MLKESNKRQTIRTLADADKLALSLFLSLSLQAVLDEKFKQDSPLLQEWALEQIAQSAMYLFPVPFEA